MITVWKNSKESFERFMSRFDQGVQRSRLVRVLREKRYRKKDLTKRQRRERALKRDEYRAKREKMKYY
jgi:ribosomal protein S21